MIYLLLGTLLTACVVYAWKMHHRHTFSRPFMREGELWMDCYACGHTRRCKADLIPR